MMPKNSQGQYLHRDAQTMGELLISASHASQASQARVNAVSSLCRWGRQDALRSPCRPEDEKKR